MLTRQKVKQLDRPTRKKCQDDYRKELQVRSCELSSQNREVIDTECRKQAYCRVDPIAGGGSLHNELLLWETLPCTTDINEKGELVESKAKVSLTRMIDENASSETNVQRNWCFKNRRLWTNFCLCDEKFGRQIDVQEKNVKTISNHCSNARMIVESKRH